MSFILAVAGGRDFSDYTLLKKILDNIFSNRKIDLIQTGDAYGADSLAIRYARERKIKYKIFIPDWNKYGKAAGIIRNEDIIKNADKVVCFWDGKSKGTKNTIDRSKRKDCVIIRYDKKLIKR
jgi:hypothetical protein